ncbi:pupal cuticle protein-like isoform X1 [Euwallacea similis]|uniref:pupal cuticle protein-like isoform X1 n=1 Tax=Euwallacea similis TaxID=1736056 RepID=UPI00344F864B
MSPLLPCYNSTGCGSYINKLFSTQETLVVDLFSNMFVKLVCIALSLSSTWAVYNGPLAGGLPASLYPAGVSPQACPNFPNCDNPAVAAHPSPVQNQWGAPQQNNWAQPQQQWNQPAPAWTQQPQQQWNAPHNNWNPQPVPQWNPGNQNALDQGGYTGDGDYHGEGLAEALAPGYENAGGWRNWNNAPQAAPSWNPGPPAGVPAHGAQIPAGVDPGSCPNYPFCG